MLFLHFLSLFFVAFCFQFVFLFVAFSLCTQRKSDKDFIGGHQVVTDLFSFFFFCFFFFNKCAWKNTTRASTYNMEIKIT